MSKPSAHSYFFQFLATIVPHRIVLPVTCVTTLVKFIYEGSHCASKQRVFGFRSLCYYIFYCNIWLLLMWDRWLYLSSLGNWCLYWYIAEWDWSIDFVMWWVFW